MQKIDVPKETTTHDLFSSPISKLNTQFIELSTPIQRFGTEVKENHKLNDLVGLKTDLIYQGLNLNRKLNNMNF